MLSLTGVSTNDAVLILYCSDVSDKDKDKVGAAEHKVVMSAHLRSRASAQRTNIESLACTQGGVVIVLASCFCATAALRCTHVMSPTGVACGTGGVLALPHMRG